LAKESMQPIEIVEIIRRSEQGMTRPYICRGEDDQIYFVKGLSAGRRSLFGEWIAGHLGVALGLPIAPFVLVSVSEELFSLDSSSASFELGAGVAFGSLKQAVTELSYSVLGQIPLESKRDLLVFDWWVKNGDRNYTENGGNPNLFWQPADEKLVIIDHNQAFDYEVNKENFFDTHIFRDHASSLCNDWLYQDEYRERLGEALGQWDEIVKHIPKSWFFIDNEMTVPADFDLEAAYAVLARYKDNEFWDWL